MIAYEVSKILETDPNIKKYADYFHSRFTRAVYLSRVILILFNFDNVCDEFVDLVFIFELKVIIMQIIGDLNQSSFQQLKKNFQEKKLLDILVEGSKRKKYSKIVNELAKKINPERKDVALELVTQKNLTLIQLGYFYISESLVPIQ